MKKKTHIRTVIHRRSSFNGFHRDNYIVAYSSGRWTTYRREPPKTVIDFMEKCQNIQTKKSTFCEDIVYKEETNA